ncbi:hypothetical protein AJ80_04180 [Polytolypa hystricis UAMH7299]|uniref:SelT/selW/selH selenoprotein domain-containing protein n=1 Tax=Polytolypa hystricis (strain UAMH7299) TaxID=1447883 RepID=A0A2B7YDP4_POLH7|nr:hypothetical protein AJ80_04180 [Polytolypa hystricis UAMH7299]
MAEESHQTPLQTPRLAEGGEESKAQAANPLSDGAAVQVHLPRITITYCTQCKWMLRAAYFAQELLSTFSVSLGEVALIPSTGGVFTVSILHGSNVDFSTQETVLWDRKTQGGFPEVKQLKSLVRNIIDPSRDLGHVDRALKAKQQQQQPSSPPSPSKNVEPGTAGKGNGDNDDQGKNNKEGETATAAAVGGKDCEDCR